MRAYLAMLAVLVSALLGIVGVLWLLHRDCIESITLRGVPFAIQYDDGCG